MHHQDLDDLRDLIPTPAAAAPGQPGDLGVARVDLVITCGDCVHRYAYDQALVDISAQPARHGTSDKLQMTLTGTRTKPEPTSYEFSGVITVSPKSWADLLAEQAKAKPAAAPQGTTP